jgi:hypothetical protein
LKEQSKQYVEDNFCIEKHLKMRAHAPQPLQLLYDLSEIHASEKKNLVDIEQVTSSQQPKRVYLPAHHCQQSKYKFALEQKSLAENQEE